jgi:hypothetical protein
MLISNNAWAISPHFGVSPRAPLSSGPPTCFPHSSLVQWGDRLKYWGKWLKLISSSYTHQPWRRMKIATRPCSNKHHRIAGSLRRTSPWQIHIDALLSCSPARPKMVSDLHELGSIRQTPLPLIGCIQGKSYESATLYPQLRTLGGSDLTAAAARLTTSSE